MLFICLKPSWNFQTIIFLSNDLFVLSINRFLGVSVSFHNELKHKHEIWQVYSRLTTCVFVFTLLDVFECSDVPLWARL